MNIPVISLSVTVVVLVITILVLIFVYSPQSGQIEFLKYIAATDAPTSEDQFTHVFTATATESSLTGKKSILVLGDFKLGILFSKTAEKVEQKIEGTKATITYKNKYMKYTVVASKEEITDKQSANTLFIQKADFTNKDEKKYLYKKAGASFLRIKI